MPWRSAHAEKRLQSPAAVGLAVGDVDGEPVGECEGPRVGDALGLALGEALGNAVGEGLGLAVGAPLGDAVGACVLSQQPKNVVPSNLSRNSQRALPVK